MAKTLYLHIGRHKTGSSAIQNFLLLNKDLLLEHSYLYPETGLTETSGQGALAWLLRKPDEETQKLFDKFYKEVKEKEPENIVISSEAFSERIKPELILKYFSVLNYEIKIIVYIRRQDEFFESSYIQAVRGDAVYKDILDYRCRLDNYNFLEPWKETFGIENIFVRIYEKEQFYQNNIFKDFLKAIQFNSEIDLKFPEKSVNKSLGYHFVSLCLHINRKYIDIDRLKDFEKIAEEIYYLDIDLKEKLQETQNTDNEDVEKKLTRKEELLKQFNVLKPQIVREMRHINDIKEIIADFFYRGDFQEIKVFLLPPEKRLELINEYEESNRKIAEEYLNRKDGKLFFKKLPDKNDNYKIPEEPNEELLNKYFSKLFPSVLKKDLKKLKDQDETIKNLQIEIKDILSIKEHLYLTAEHRLNILNNLDKRRIIKLLKKLHILNIPR